MFTPGSLRGRDVELSYNGGWADLIRVDTADQEAWPIAVTIQVDRRRPDEALPPAESGIEIEIEWGARDGRTKSARVRIALGRTFTIPAASLKVRARNVGGGQTENWPTAMISAHAAAGAVSSWVPISTAIAWTGAPLSGGASGGAKLIPAWAARWRLFRAPSVAVRLWWRGGANQVLEETWIDRRTLHEGLVPLGADRVELFVDDPTPTSQVSIEFDLALS
jgi:hypothetical protein